jgi:Cytochrome b5-like Heme/Steroid binding domain
MLNLMLGTSRNCLSSNRRHLYKNCLLLILGCVTFLFVAVRGDDSAAAAAAADNTTKDYTRGARVISKDELALHNGKDSPDLWLSILGEVYDVTKGSQYYGAGSSYSVFVGRDGSAAFVTGNFTPEGAEAALLDALTDNQLYQLDTWKDFYTNEDKYPFVGILHGTFYDAHGRPTPELERVRKASAEGKVLQEERNKKIQERIAQAKKEREEKKRQAAMNGVKEDMPEVQEL